MSQARHRALPRVAAVRVQAGVHHCRDGGVHHCPGAARVHAMRWLNPCIGLLGATLTLGCGNSDENPNNQDNSNGQTSGGGNGHTAAGIATSNSDGPAGTTSGAHNSISTSSTTAPASTVGNAAATGVGTTSGAGGAGVSSTTDGSGGGDSATASTDSQAGGTGGVGTATTSTTGEPDPCYALSGQTYATVDELECGNTPAGPMFCTWTISFTAVEFQWSRADTLQTGTYSCENGAISAEGAGQVLEGELYEDGSLMWEGQTYVQAD